MKLLHIIITTSQNVDTKLVKINHWKESPFCKQKKITFGNTFSVGSTSKMVKVL